MRIKLAKFFILGALAFLAIYIFRLQIVKGLIYRQLSKTNAIRIIPQEGARGRILDSAGNVLVDNRFGYDVFVSVQDVFDKENLFKRLAFLLGVCEDEITKEFRKNYYAPFAPVRIAQDIDRFKAMRIEMHNADLPGVTVWLQPRRNYPYKNLASHILGYLGEIDYWRLNKLTDYGYAAKDIVGYGGIEERYDYYLRSHSGGIQIEVDHRGVFKRTLGFKEPLNGKDIQLTIELELQKIIEECLTGHSGAIIVMDPYDGKILAMASKPDFYPEMLFQGLRAYTQSVFKDKQAPLLNRAVSAAYPPGSVFKLITAIAGLSCEKINSSTTFYCAGSLRVGKREFACWDVHGSQNLLQAITHSCDVFFYRTGLLVGAQSLYEYALKFGLSKATGIDLPLETNGFIPSPFWRKTRFQRAWYDGDTANFAIGQGEVLTTPLQITRMLAVFANGGYLVTPYLVKAIDGKDISFQRRKIIPVAVKPEFIKMVKKGLRAAIEDATGTAHVLNFEKLPIAGKTGTAEAPPGQPHSWFVGFFPFASPKYVLCVFLEHGGSSYYACLIAKKIIEKMLAQNLL